MINPRSHEVRWYRANGKYPDRIGHTCPDQEEYVIGDQAWNAKNPRRVESVDQRMASYVRSVDVEQMNKGASHG